jgi:hypothetical protein
MSDLWKQTTQPIQDGQGEWSSVRLAEELPKEALQES